MKKKEELDEIPLDVDIGHIFWELENYENFFPVYKSMMKKSDK